MRIKIITVGKTREKFWRLAEQKYGKRLNHYVQLEQVSVKEAPADALKNIDLALQKEATEILSQIADAEYVLALDAGGQQMSSEKLADFLQQNMLHGNNKMAFVIGGPFGLSKDVLQRADMRLSLSQMTLPHEMAKIILLEQIYRAFSILRGEKYHK